MLHHVKFKSLHIQYMLPTAILLRLSELDLYSLKF